MELEAKKVGTVTVVRCTGRLDTDSSPKAQSYLGRLIDEGASKMVIDLARVEVLSSAGFGVLVAIAHRLDEAGGSLRLSGPNQVVREVFEISGYSSQLDVYVTLDEALAEY